MVPLQPKTIELNHQKSEGNEKKHIKWPLHIGFAIHQIKVTVPAT